MKPACFTAIRHPAWCDLARCTANPASQADGYRHGVGGEHLYLPKMPSALLKGNPGRRVAVRVCHLCDRWR